jgi:hypothetical protein
MTIATPIVIRAAIRSAWPSAMSRGTVEEFYP